MQEAFIEAGAFQCGYCTPGFLLMTTQLLDSNPDPDDDQIRHYLSGNLCRCAAYPEIINAVKIAARKRKGRSAELTSMSGSWVMSALVSMGEEVHLSANLEVE